LVFNQRRNSREGRIFRLRSRGRLKNGRIGSAEQRDAAGRPAAGLPARIWKEAEYARSGLFRQDLIRNGAKAGDFRRREGAADDANTGFFKLAYADVFRQR
jgi:hypothetical protein